MVKVHFYRELENGTADNATQKHSSNLLFSRLFLFTGRLIEQIGRPFGIYREALLESYERKDEGNYPSINGIAWILYACTA